MSKIDWSDVLSCSDLDLATAIFTWKIKCVLDVHAPWIKFQQRNFFCPWLTEGTKKLIKERDECKQKAKNLAVRERVLGTNSVEQVEDWGWNLQGGVQRLEGDSEGGLAGVYEIPIN